MAALETPAGAYGWEAAPFRLRGTDGVLHTREDVRGPNGLLVMFICNHCPYVQSVIDRVIDDVSELRKLGIGSAAIMPNDTQAYPEDSFEHMQKFAREKGFDFPYLLDDGQEVAKSYGAVCTPDFFGFGKDLKLQYRGRLDASGPEDLANPRRELLDAMRSVVKTGACSRDQRPSIGCSIKWSAR